MPNEDINTSHEKAIAFFERAEEVASTDNFDYAIDMYLEGMRLAPDDVDLGHAKLRELALLRQVKGGKKPSVVEKLKGLKGKTGVEKLVNTELLFAKDPDNLSYAGGVLKVALHADFENTVKWVADLMFEANSASEKPSINIYLQLKNAYSEISLFDRAMAALICLTGLGKSSSGATILTASLATVYL